MVAYFEGKQQVTGFGLRITRLGHVVRGGVPTSADRVIGSRLGAAAVDCLADGAAGNLVGVVRGEIVRTPLVEVAGRTRPADTALIELARVLAM
jgi:6-phosphofructokinase 1